MKHMQTKRQTKDKAMNIWEKVNVGSLGLGIVAMGAMGIYSLSPSLSLSPSADTSSLPALIDTQEGTYIVYPDVLPPCDEEDGTATSNSLPVAACKWDNGTGHAFIVIAP
jgi:hypothetical protein